MKEKIFQLDLEAGMDNILKFQLCGTTYPDAKYQINRGMSSVYCIEYIEDGIGTLNHDDDVFFPHSGDSWLLHKGASHSYYSNPINPWKKHFINVRGTLIDALIAVYELSDAVYFEGLDIKNEILQIIETAEKKKSPDTSVIVALINEILIKMHRHTQVQGKIPEIGKQMKEFMNAHVTREFNIDLLADHIHKSRSQTIRIFKNIFGITPYQYIIGKKIGLSKKLLENTNLSAKEIAAAVGFTDAYSFSHQFKNKVGKTPLEHRRRYANSKIKNP